MLVSRIVKENLNIDSKAYNELSPKMKDAVSDVFRQVEKSTGDIIKRFEGAVDKVSQHYNINTTELNDYFDKEVIEPFFVEVILSCMAPISVARVG